MARTMRSIFADPERFDINRGNSAMYIMLTLALVTEFIFASVLP